MKKIQNFLIVVEDKFPVFFGYFLNILVVAVVTFFIFKSIPEEFVPGMANIFLASPVNLLFQKISALGTFEAVILLYAIGGILVFNSWLLKKGVISPGTTPGKIVAIFFGFLGIFFFFAGAAIMFLIAGIADIPRIFKAPTPH